MAAVLKDGTIKVVLTYGFDGKPSINVHFVLQRTPASPIPVAVLEAAADAAYNAYLTDWIPFMGDQWTIDEITATDWSVVDGAEAATTEALPMTGTAITEECPASVCLVVSHRTGLTGRSRRGRTYLAGLVEGNVGGNVVDGNLTVAAGDTFDEFDTLLDAASLDHVVYSTVFEGAPRLTGLASVITSRIVNFRVDTQRRRLP